MSLSCNCDFEPEPGQICWYPPNDFTQYSGKRATRCASCGGVIKSGEDIGKFELFKIPDDDIEVKIYGDDGEIPRAPKYHCERCAGLFFSLDDLGYCLSFNDDMRELVKEYAEDHSTGDTP